MTVRKDAKITVFGDSIGKGIVTDNLKPEVFSDNAVSLFERQSGVKIDNRSVFGQSLKRVVSRGLIDGYINGLDKTQNNVAVIELGGNDADFNWREVALSPNQKHDSKTTVKEFDNCYGEAIYKLKDAGVRVIACTIVPVHSERFFNSVIGGLADKERVLEFFKGDYNTIHRHQEMFNNEILKNAYKHGVEVIDLRSKFLETNEFESLMCHDGIHPNGSGHIAIYGAIAEFLETNTITA